MYLKELIILGKKKEKEKEKKVFILI